MSSIRLSLYLKTDENVVIKIQGYIVKEGESNKEKFRCK